jgi:ABC-type amino acid transport substrate-binding protein
MKGYCYDLAMEISHKLSMAPVISLVADGKYGQMDDEGNWNGLMGEVVSGKADIAVADLTIREQRKASVSFTQPFMISPLAFVQLTPPVAYLEKNVLAQMFNVFHLGNWVLLLISIPLITIGLWLISFLVNEDELKVCSNSVYYIATTLLFLAPTTQPKTSIVRIYTYIWLIFRLIVVLSYGSRLIAIHGVQWSTPPPEALRTFDDLAANTKTVKIGMIGGGSTEAKFKQANDQNFQTIYQNFERNTFKPVNQKEGITGALEDGANVFISELPSLKFAVQQHCDLSIGGVEKYSMHPQNGYGIAVSKDNPELYALIASALQELEIDGFLRRLEKKWWDDSNSVCDVENDAWSFIPPEIGIHQMIYVYLFVLALILYSLGVFIYTRFAPVSRKEPNETDEIQNLNDHKIANAEQKA